MLFKNEEIDKIFTSRNSFTIKFHHFNQYDQIKGRNTVALFQDNELVKVKVYGNGECLYYVNNEEEKEFTGVNIIECSSMNVYFTEGDLSDISFVTSPKARFHPPQGLTNEKKYLERFNWRWEEKPSRKEFEDIILIYFPNYILKKETSESVVIDSVEDKKDSSRKKEKKHKFGKGLLRKKKI